MHINTSVVKALMALRGISAQNLSNIVQVSMPAMIAWLSDEDLEGHGVSFESQLEVLTVLGVKGEAPRNDVVHYWRVQESFFAGVERAYWPLQIMTRAFGGAGVAFLGRESDKLIAWTAQTHFMLKFDSFTAILEVTSNPISSVKFSPELVEGLSWLQDSFGVLLPEKEYDNLQPGAMQVTELRRYLTFNAEMAKWEALREQAFEKGILAHQVAGVLESIQPALPGITQPATEERPTKRVAAQEPSEVEVEAQTREVPREVARESRSARSASAAIPDLRSGSEDMRLFVTPVKVPVEQPVKVKRVA